jgi:AraC family transcriptional regulator, arabinose operon regulatory protein
MLEREPGMGGSEIARTLNISQTRLGRMFKAVKGMSLVDYRNRLRLQRFVALLDGGETNLLEAALEAGFGSYSHFHRVFRAQLHATPREYLRPSNGNRGGAKPRG